MVKNTLFFTCLGILLISQLLTGTLFAQERINVTAEAPEIDGTADGVANLNGRIVLSKKIKSNENIPVGSLTKGVYMATIETDEGTIQRKLVKQ